MRAKEFIAQDIDLVKYIKEKYYYLFGLILKLASNRPELIKEAKALTKEKILELLKTRRPDLYTVLQTPEGQAWWEKQDFQQFFTII
jgi:hypothetical protein